MREHIVGLESELAQADERVRKLEEQNTELQQQFDQVASAADDLLEVRFTLL